jgi:hypothetical protein
VEWKSYRCKRLKMLQNRFYQVMEIKVCLMRIAFEAFVLKAINYQMQGRLESSPGRIEMKSKEW